MKPMCSGFTEFGAYLEQAYGNNLLEHGASLACTQAAPGHPIQAVLQEGDETYFRTPDGVTQAEIILRWPQEQSIRRVVLRENLLESQRIEQYALDMETPQAGGKLSVAVWWATSAL